jgi:hypothetical protein
MLFTRLTGGLSRQLLLPCAVTLQSRHKLFPQRSQLGFKLLNSRSAALDQNAQHNNKENAGNYPDQGYTLHVNPPSSQ